MARWTLDLGVDQAGNDVAVADDEITAGEHAAIYSLVVEAVPHAEVDIDPLHCPICRHAHLAVLAGTRCGRPVLPEIARLGAMLRDDVLHLVVLPLKV